MKNISSPALRALTLTGLMLAPAAAQWTASSSGLPETLGFYHGMNLIIKGGGNLYVTGNNSLHRSTDNAATWTNIITGLPSGARISWIAATPTRLYAAYYTSSPTTGGFHYSTDGGTTWINTGLTVGGNYISGLAVSGDTVVAYDGRPRFHRSVDAGATWTTVTTVPPARSGNLGLLNGVVYASGDNGLHRSTDLGDSWTKIADHDAASFARVGSTLYHGGNPSVRRSTDNGLTWTVTGTGLPTGTVNSLVAKDSVLVATVSNAGTPGPFASTNSGATWTQFRDGLANNQTLGSVVEKDGMLYASGAGVFKRSLTQATTAIAPASSRSSTGVRVFSVAPGQVRIAAPGVAGPVSVRVHTPAGKVVTSRGLRGRGRAWREPRPLRSRRGGLSPDDLGRNLPGDPADRSLTLIGGRAKA